jgi:hypothetical protein
MKNRIFGYCACLAIGVFMAGMLLDYLTKYSEGNMTAYDLQTVKNFTFFVAVCAGCGLPVLATRTFSMLNFIVGNSLALGSYALLVLSH